MYTYIYIYTYIYTYTYIYIYKYIHTKKYIYNIHTVDVNILLLLGSRSPGHATPLQFQGLIGPAQHHVPFAGGRPGRGNRGFRGKSWDTLGIHWDEP